MTRAEIITDIRNLINEQSTDAGALLNDAGNLLTFIDDAAQQVMLDLMPIMPGQFLATENISLVANTQAYTFTASFWQIWKIERNVTNESPREIDIIDPLEAEFYAKVGETDTEPRACYLLGDTLYWVPTPSASYSNFAKAYLVRPEAATVPSGGPAYLPAVCHRLIVYQACVIIATMLERDTSPYEKLYARRFIKVNEVWRARNQQSPRFVNPSVALRRSADMRDPALYDKGWENM